MTQQNPKPVVVAVGHDPFDGALDYAIAQAVRERCGLHLVHAVHIVPSGPELMLLDLSDVKRIGRETLQLAAERVLDLLPEGVPLTTQLVEGPVVASIVAAAVDARVVVLQRRDLGHLMKVVTRSVSSGVAAHATVPVVSVPTGWCAPIGGPGVVTVGVDEAERCRAILGAAVSAARARRATLHVLHTWWFPSVYDDVILARAEDASWNERARDEIARVLHELGGVEDLPVRIESRRAHAADALIGASAESDLLVVGRHDPLVPMGSHLGPVARAVLRDASCPVLLADPRPVHRREPDASARLVAEPV
jgi:nucleotide-binding universal stress UspA family protein